MVAGVWRDYIRQHGAVVIERDRYVRLTGDRNASDAALWLADGADAGAVRQAIRSALPGGDSLEIAAPGEIRARSMQAFDRTFAVTYVLELVALVIGLTGLSSSFGALVLARRREFGMLRHLGMTRRQVGAMLATEGLAVSALGLAVGLALGGIISLILIHVVNRQSFHWSMDLAIPWAPLGRLLRRDARRGGGDRDGERARRDGGRCGTGGQGGLVVRRRVFLATPLALLVRGAPAADAYPDVVRGARARIPARSRRTPRVPDRVVVRHRLAALGRARPRLPGHVLPQPAAHRRRQSERVRAAAAPLRARRDRGPGRRTTAARPARRAGGLRPRRGRRGNDRRSHRRLVDGARRRRVSNADRRARVRVRARVRAVAADPAAGRSGVQPQGPGGGPGELLLQPSASGGARHGGARRAARARRRLGLARSRVVERVSGARGGGLGLGRAQPRRRRRTDGVSHPRQSGRRLLGRAAAGARRAVACASSRRATFRSSRCAGGARRVRRSSTR